MISDMVAKSLMLRRCVQGFEFTSVQAKQFLVVARLEIEVGSFRQGGSIGRINTHFDRVQRSYTANALHGGHSMPWNTP